MFFFQIGMDDLTQENEEVEFSDNLHTHDKAYLSNLMTEELPEIQFVYNPLNQAELEQIEIFELLAEVPHISELYNMVQRFSIAIQFVTNYDILQGAYTDEQIEKICRDLLIVFAPKEINRQLLIVVLDFFIAIPHYEDSNAINGKMSFYFFKQPIFRKRLNYLFKKEIEARESDQGFVLSSIEGDDKTILARIGNIYSEFFKYMTHFNELQFDLLEHAQFIENIMKSNVISSEEKLIFMRSFRKLSPHFRNDPNIDLFLDVFKQNIKRLSDVHGLDIELLKLLRKLVFKPDEKYLQHIFLETKLLDGNPVINYVKFCLDTEDKPIIQLYAMHVLLNIISMSPQFFHSLDIGVEGIMDFLASNDPNISNPLLRQITDIITSSHSVALYLCQNELLSCLQNIYHSQSPKGKLQIFLILKSLVVRFPDCISSDYILERVIPISIDVLRYGEWQKIQVVFTLLQHLIKKQLTTDEGIGYIETFYENDGLDVLQDLVEETENPQDKGRIQTFISRIEDVISHS